MTILGYVLLIAVVLISGGAAFSLKQKQPQLINYALGFSGAFLLGMCFLHLLPEAIMLSGPSVGLYALLGFFIQLVLVQFTGGIEHGHAHVHVDKSDDPKNKNKLLISVMLGLCVHAFIEGMPLPVYGGEHLHNHDHAHGHSGTELLFGIIIHKIPAAFALGLLLVQSGFNLTTRWLSIILLAIMSPLGAFMAQYLVTEGVSVDISSAVLAIAAGSILHVSTTILFESEKGSRHQVSWTELLVITIGLTLSILTMH